MKRNFIAFLCAATVFAIATVSALSDITEEPIYAVGEQAPQNEAPITSSDGICYVGNGFTVTNYPETAQKGEKVRVSASADDDTVIYISVYYASGKSEAKVFSPKTASPGSEAVWEWTIPKTASSEAIRIVLRSDTCYASFEISLH